MEQRVEEALKARIAELEAALDIFFRVLRGHSWFVTDAYELHVKKDAYSEARTIYDRRAALTPDRKAQT